MKEVTRYVLAGAGLGIISVASNRLKTGEGFAFSEWVLLEMLGASFAGAWLGYGLFLLQRRFNR